MLTFGEMQTQFQDLSQDNSSEALTFGKKNINLGLHILETELGSFYTEETYTDLTEDGVRSYPTPDQFVRLQQAYVTVGNIRYEMQEIMNEQLWQKFIASQTQQESDIATHIFIRRDRFEVYPTPSSAGNTITLIYEGGGRDLYADDYVEGTITTLANGAKAVTASGSTFTSAMAGRYFKINAYPVWYKIATFGTTTTLTLDKEYTGISIAAGTEAYTIGEMPRTPGATHQIPVYYALMQYFNGFKLNEEKGKYYKNLYEDDLARAKITFAQRYSGNYIPGKKSLNAQPINPNLYPSGMAGY
jgi:hypothetical protein